VREVTGRAPRGSGETGECRITLYGGGQWSNYDDLKRKVQATFDTLSPHIIASGHIGNACLDVGSGTASVQRCNGSSGQRFAYRANDYGQLRQGNRCLSTDTPGQVAWDYPKGKTLVMTSCRNVAAQRWGSASDGFLRNEQGWCADIDSERRELGTRVLAWTCRENERSRATNQRWGYFWRPSVEQALGLGLITPAQANAARSAPAGAVIDRNGRLIGNDAGSLVGNNGNTLIGADGASIVAAGAGNIVAAGAGNIVAAGAGNIVAAGAGN
jgi:hypothetical protein